MIVIPKTMSVMICFHSHKEWHTAL